jgi:MFS family permease
VNSARAWLVWGAAVFAYVVAVLQRSSLGVSGVEAQHLFGVSASTLSTLAVVQLVVYAGLQIPVGVLLDRVGPKRLIVAGAVLLAASWPSRRRPSAWPSWAACSSVPATR